MSGSPENLRRNPAKPFLARKARNKTLELRVFAVFFHPSRRFTGLGGAEKRFLNVLKRWVDEYGVSVTVVEPGPGLVRSQRNCKALKLDSFFPFRASGFLGLYFEWVLWMVQACFACASIVKRGNYNVVLAANNTVPNLAVAYFVHLVSHKPLCVVVHHLDVQDARVAVTSGKVYRTYRNAGYSRFLALLKAAAFRTIVFFLKRSDMCIAVSRFTAETLTKNGVSASKIFVSGNGTSFEKLGGRTAELKEYDAVFVGRISREKGVFDLVKIWRKLADRNLGFRLIIIGSGPDLRELRSHVKRAGLERLVTVKGACSDGEMYSLVKASKVFLFPSRFEGWGLAVGEALACGLPVLCYKIPALEEVFGECPAVVFTKLADWEALAEKLTELLVSGGWRRLSSQASTYSRRFTWRKVAEKDLEFVRLAAAKRGFRVDV